MKCLSKKLLKSQEHFAINVWEKCKGCKTLDELKYKLSSQTDLAAKMLPPTEDSFYHHVMRCLYQTKLWCNSHIAKPTLPDPDGHGWHMLPDGTLDLKFFEKEAAPATLRDVTTCIVLVTSALMPLIVNVC